MPKKQTQPTRSAGFAPRFLSLTESVSRAADTFGYRRVVLTDGVTGVRTTAVGGGYDLIGSALGEWMEAHIQDRLDALHPQTKTVGPYPRPLYGVRFKGTESVSGHQYEHAVVDGACGLDTMIDIAGACGVTITQVWSGPRSNRSIGFLTDESPAASETAPAITTTGETK